jgi:hypothetical protein
MDLDSFFTLLYVIIDDWYKAQIMKNKPKVGRPVQLSDSEVITLAIACNWRCGVPWQSERGFIRYMLAHGKRLFPKLVNQSTFNQRSRYLYGAILQFQQVLVEWLEQPTDIYECVDLLELPAYSPGHALRQKTHWLWQSTKGYGAHGQWFYGDWLLGSVTASGVITGYLIGTAQLDDRWLMEAFLSMCAGCPQLQEPSRKRARGWSRASPVPCGYIGGFQAVGVKKGRPYLADKGFNGLRWSSHWQQYYDAEVITVPFDHSKSEPVWTPHDKKWHAGRRQIVETVFSVLDTVFDIKHLNAHSRWGQLTRIACKVVGFNVGIFINRMMGRKYLFHATLIC